MRVVIRRTSISEGARALADALALAGVRAILSGRERFRRSRLIVNWGSTAPLYTPHATDVANHPASIETARNKLSTFHKLEYCCVQIPRFWTHAPSDAERGKSIILERHSLNGQGGSGIVVKRLGDNLASAPLYVEYIKKVKEFRVHVFNGKAIAVQEKRRESGGEQTADQKLIRNRDNGWVFCINDVVQPEGLADLGVSAVRALDLDFGAVDIIQGKDGELYVLEVNTRPGLESPTVLAAYVEAIKERMTNGGRASNT